MGYLRSGFTFMGLTLGSSALIVLGCAGSADSTDDPASVSTNELLKRATGALVNVTMTSRVAVVLDEIPQSQRSALAAHYLSRPESFWIDRAKRQLEHTNYRLTYRNFFYEDGNRRTLALPPRTRWQITLDSPRPRRLTTRDGHDAVQMGYSFSSALLTDPASPGAAEPRLQRIGGVWNEPFNLPLDPEFVFQRTGYACMDEDGYPLGTVRSENEAYLFDQECAVETVDTASCHLTTLPRESCLDALARQTGRVDTALRFERVAYQGKAADAARYGEFTQPSAPDLAVIADQLGNNWVEYRYFPTDSCAIQENCIGGPGWRRLLAFDASIRNSGPEPLVVGSTDASSPARLNNMFEFSACHEHFHFRHYGDFRYGSTPGDKRAFCVESTDRYFNNERTPLVHDFSCDNQGVAPGWGDTYIAGVECNWIDVTDLSIPASGTTRALRFQVNPDDFLCEGQPVLDDQGNPIYDPTEFVTEQGEPVNRPRCKFAAGYDSNNVGERPITLAPAGGIITAKCTREQAGPLRDCGFAQQKEGLACEPGTSVNLTCRVTASQSNQVVRICDNSAKLGGIACMYADALANRVVTPQPTQVSFTCPSERDSSEPGGTYSVYVTPVLPNDPLATVICRAF